MYSRRVTGHIGYLALFALGLLWLSGPAAAQPAKADAGGAASGACPLTSADFASTDYASVRTACDIESLAADQFCQSCVCGLGTAIVLGFERAGVKINGQPVSTLAASGDTAALNTVLGNCSAVLGVELLQAGALTADALGQLATCDVDQSTLSCAGAVNPAAPADVPAPAAAAPPAPAAPVQQGSSQPPAAAPAPAVKSAGEATSVSLLGMVAALMMGAALLL